MRYAFISDIHSNYTALKTALEKIQQLQVDKILCLGDIVGYGAEPNECLAAVKKYCHYTILGNHDLALIEENAAKNFNPEAKIAIEWNRKKTKRKYFHFLRSLPYKLKFKHFLAAHANPWQPKKWTYVHHHTVQPAQWQNLHPPLCFIGHSHIPVVITPKKEYSTHHCKIPPSQKCIVNVGSIGQPRDGDRRLSFGVYDTNNGLYQLFRLDYDYERAVKKIRNAGLPAYLSNRLLFGK
ncbi:MAG: metallophosphoesterase [Planctomycetota bacterium]|nr:MAG: metallophosphoesterase [Planctomycetota bacterium]